jgi:murein DD-endopeptidase MepM/ murein hydrolase activator NlpD
MRLHPLHGLVIAIILLGGLSFKPGGLSGGLPDERALAAPVEALSPFLYPPFPGSASEESIFDHSSPNYSQTDNRIVSYGGHEADKNCPSPEPPGVPPAQAGVCDAGFGLYWSYDLGGWMAYNGHDGIDYGISYRPVYAAADADRIIYAGWADPQNHTTALGINVQLHHSNGYITSYGHMSAIAEQACPSVGCAIIPHGEMLGISGNTGNSTGPHLHFQLTAPNGKSVDPYGWGGSGNDPWPYNQPESLWVMYPSMVYYGIRALPTGNVELPYPPAAPAGILVDDSSSGFVQSPDQCWNDINVSVGQAQNNNMSYSKPRLTGPTCTGQWRFPIGSAPGLYAVYIRIPAVHATTEGALYTIQHAGASARVVINQAVYPNNFYVTDGWVYGGKYNFDGSGVEYIQLANQTQDESAVVSTLQVGADAVRFVFLGVVTPTPPPVTLTPTFTPTITKTPTVTKTSPPTLTPSLTKTLPPSLTPTTTRTSTPSLSPTPSKTPTASKTATATRTPTATRTATKTPTASRTPTNTATRLPTAIPPYTKLNVYFVNRVLLSAGTPPYEVAGYRWVKSSDNFVQSVLNAYFKGPGDTEKYVYRWIAIYDGFTGYSKLEVADGIARLYLKGACSATDRIYTIAGPLNVNLKQFSSIQFVKLYDENGTTENPDGATDSIPTCLDPAFAPSPTVTPTLSFSPTPTSTRTVTPTPTKRATATPQYIIANVFFADKRRLNNGIPPYEVAGVRWVQTNNIPANVLTEFFKGPGATEKYTYGWIAVYSGATGFSRLDITGGIARVYLKGQCNSQGATYTIADLLRANLKQFSAIQFVKIYDQNGNTELSDGDQDSIPACLEP